MEPNNDWIDDALVDEIVIVPAEVAGLSRPVGEIKGPPETLVLTSTLGFFGWGVLSYIASGVRDREGCSIDETGFRYPTDELDPGEKPFEGVNVYNPLGDVYVSISAFERLMARYFRVIIEGVKARNDPKTQQPWWPEFVANTEAIERRLKSEREEG